MFVKGKTLNFKTSMRSKNILNTIKSIFIGLMLLFGVSTVNSQTIFTIATADGYGENTTGGNVANTITVTTATAFKSAAESGTSMVVIVDGFLNIGEVSVASNKTIIGADTNAGWTGNLTMSGVDNVIVQNLNISNPTGLGTADGIEISNGCTNIFVHKCTFIDCADGSLDIKRGSDFVTFSWCRFRYPTQTVHNFANLIGHDDANGAQDRGKLHITTHHNWYDIGCDQRMPRVRFATVHSYNNYYAAPGNLYCIGTGLECHIRLENGSFENMNNPWRDMSGGMVNGEEIGWSGCLFVGTTVPSYAPNSFPVFTPPYTYALDLASDVKDLTIHPTCGAGNCGPCVTAPTLTLTSGTASQSVSAGTAITSIVYTWGGNATDVNVTGLSTGVIATKNAGAKTVTISGTPTITSIYSVTTVQPVGTAVSLAGTITVIPLPSCLELVTVSITSLAATGTYELILFDAAGTTEIKVLADDTFNAGDFDFIFAKDGLATGTYAYKLMSGATVIKSGPVVIP